MIAIPRVLPRPVLGGTPNSVRLTLRYGALRAGHCRPPLDLNERKPPPPHPDKINLTEWRLGAARQDPVALGDQQGRRQPLSGTSAPLIRPSGPGRLSRPLTSPRFATAGYRPMMRHPSSRLSDSPIS